MAHHKAESIRRDIPLQSRAALPDALAQTRAFADEARIATDIRARLAIIVEELVGNAFEHGNAAESGPVEIVLLAQGDAITVTITERGTPFDPRDAPEATTPNAERGGGMGLSLIRQWADIFAYRSANGVNRLELRLRAAD